MKLKKGSKAAKNFMAKIRAKKGKSKPKAKKINGNLINNNDNSNFFEKNIQEYNKYNHLVIYRNYRGRDSAKLNNKIISLKKAYNLIDKKEYNFFDQIVLGNLLIIQYKKLK